MYSVKHPSLYSKTILLIPACELEVEAGTFGLSSVVGLSVNAISLTVEGGVSSIGVRLVDGDSDDLPNNNQSVE
jgi:hypothetical protein